MAHYGTRKVVLGTEWDLGTLHGYGSDYPRKRAVPKTGLEPVSLSAADFKSDVYTVPPLGPTSPKCGRTPDWQPGKAAGVRLRLALGTKPGFLPHMAMHCWLFGAK